MRQITKTTAVVGAIVLGSALAAAATASAEPDVTVERCVQGGGGPFITFGGTGTT